MLFRSSPPAPGSESLALSEIQFSWTAIAAAPVSVPSKRRRKPLPCPSQPFSSRSPQRPLLPPHHEFAETASRSCVSEVLRSSSHSLKFLCSIVLLVMYKQCSWRVAPARGSPIRRVLDTLEPETVKCFAYFDFIFGLILKLSIRLT